MPSPESVALLTNFLAPYRRPVLRELQSRCSELHILLSTRMERGREWPADWSGLSVQVQKNISWTVRWRHPHQFVEPTTVHFPYDTLNRLRAIRPKVVISGELGLRTLQAMVYCLLFRSHLVIWATVSELTEMNRGALRMLLRRFLLGRAAAVIVNGSSGRRYVERFNVAPNRIFHAPQTTDIQPFLSVPLQRTPVEQKRLLYSGRLIELKGLMPFLAELGKWAIAHPSKDVEVWFVGDGPLQEPLRNIERPANLYFRFLGHVPYADLHEVYAKAGILVFPSLADEWGLVVVEAMASGMPVLGSKYSQAVEDLVCEGENGWSFRPGCADEMQAALDQALNSSPQRLCEMGTAARRAVQHLTPAAMASNIVAALTYATTDHPRRP